MDLSQYNLKTIKNLQKVKIFLMNDFLNYLKLSSFKFPNLKFLDYSCNQITKLENLKFKNLIELRIYANQIELVENLDR